MGIMQILYRHRPHVVHVGAGVDFAPGTRSVVRGDGLHARAQPDARAGRDGILRPEAQYIDALVAPTIALIGAENIGDGTQRPLPVAIGLGGILFVMASGRYLGLGETLPALLLVGGGIFSVSYLMLTGKRAMPGACDCWLR